MVRIVERRRGTTAEFQSVVIDVLSVAALYIPH
jgi:hypothetical protein